MLYILWHMEFESSIIDETDCKLVEVKDEKTN